MLISDNGANLCGEIMTSVASYFNLTRIMTSVAHPQSNASVERAHARLAEFVRATETEIENMVSWELKLKLASYCYNTTVHSATGFTPYYLMFGRQARPITGIGRPIDLVPDSYLENFNYNLRVIWQKAKENIVKVKEQAVERENMKTKRQKVEDFKVNDRVLVKTETFKGRVNRTQDTWLGPYVVSEVRPTALLIKKRNRVSLVNKAYCKVFVEPTN